MERGKTHLSFFAVDSFLNGISFGRYKADSLKEAIKRLALNIQDQDLDMSHRRRHSISSSQRLVELEKNLLRLSQRGILRRSVIFFGVTTDPFHPFEGKFDVSIKFLNLFSKYMVGHLIVQTRSPLIVIALPVLRKLGKRVEVHYALETDDDDVRRRYTPELPAISDRLRAIDVLRNFGVHVRLLANPVLPYGDWENDALRFAKLLSQKGDTVSVASFCDGTSESERAVKRTRLWKLLLRDRQYFWLRKDAACHILSALSKLAPEKLEEPHRHHLEQRQLEIFAA